MAKSSELSEQELKAIEAIGKFIAEIIVIPIRCAIIAFTLLYVMSFWLAYAQSPNHWHWSYGAILGLVPFRYGVWVCRLSIVAAIATFIASFFLAS